MVPLQKNLLTITIIMLCLGYVNSEAKFNVFALCSCEELLYESECKLFPHCQYSNSACSSKACSSLNTEKVCQYNTKCAWYNNACSNFKSCSEYGITDSKVCHSLHETCQFNPFTKKCARYDQAFTSSCSSTSKDQCLLGSDGVCQYKNEQCQKLQSCSNSDSNDPSCFLAFPACYPNDVTTKCDSLIGCQNAKTLSCAFASDGINSYNYYLCQEGNGNTCVDFNLTIQTIDTCFYDSFGYYHWTGSACEVCKSSSYSLLLAIASFILLIVL